MNEIVLEKENKTNGLFRMPPDEWEYLFIGPDPHEFGCLFELAKKIPEENK